MGSEVYPWLYLFAQFSLRRARKGVNEWPLLPRLYIFFGSSEGLAGFRHHSYAGLA